VGTDTQDGLLNIETVSEAADLFLLAGDLTQRGRADELKPLTDRLRRLSIPVVAVLGNHDFHQGEEQEIRSRLEAVGVSVLEGESWVLELQGQRVGIAGVKGFGGGFAGACATEFGETEMKRFIRHTREITDQFRRSLESMRADLKVSLTHYAPTHETLSGERLEIYPFLGSYLLGEAIDAAGCNLAVHGHAHLGVERGTTPGGVPVRNVARPVIQVPYKVYCISPQGAGESC
jgi:Icc-related predicted phosphoesterase